MRPWAPLRRNMEPRAGLDPATYRCLAPGYEAIALG